MDYRYQVKKAGRIVAYTTTKAEAQAEAKRVGGTVKDTAKKKSNPKNYRYKVKKSGKIVAYTTTKGEAQAEAKRLGGTWVDSHPTKSGGLLYEATWQGSDYYEDPFASSYAQNPRGKRKNKKDSALDWSCRLVCDPTDGKILEAPVRVAKPSKPAKPTKPAAKPTKPAARATGQRGAKKLIDKAIDAIGKQEVTDALAAGYVLKRWKKGQQVKSSAASKILSTSQVQALKDVGVDFKKGPGVKKTTKKSTKKPTTKKKPKIKKEKKEKKPTTKKAEKGKLGGKRAMMAVLPKGAVTDFIKGKIQAAKDAGKVFVLISKKDKKLKTLTVPKSVGDAVILAQGLKAGGAGSTVYAVR